MFYFRVDCCLFFPTDFIFNLNIKTSFLQTLNFIIAIVIINSVIFILFISLFVQVIHCRRCGNPLYPEVPPD